MKKYALSLLSLVLLLSMSTTLSAQVNDLEIKRRAKEFISHERYQQALAVLSTSDNLMRNDKEARLLTAVCQYQTNALDAALRNLTELTSDGRTPYPECWLYLAKVYHARHQFAEATNHYKTYLRSVFPNHPHRRMVVEEIRRCANGLQQLFRAAPAVVENLGRGVNTAEDEFAPIASPTRNDRLYFSAIRQQNTGGPRDNYGRPDAQWGQYFSDMFVTEVHQGQWNAAQPMHFLLNSPRHDILLGFDDTGQAMYFFKGWSLSTGEIVVDTFRSSQERKLSSTPLVGPLKPQSGDTYPVFYRDTLVIFASNRPGGYGGWDLYKSNRINGQWSPPVNLGPTVNTPYDETTPFIALDGRTLYFSSNDSRKSMGGLDVFKTYFIPERQQWLPPANVGMPINSAGDDSHFRISRDGFTAFFCSSRKDGFGKRDIYVAYFQDFLPEMEYPEDYFATTTNKLDGLHPILNTASPTSAGAESDTGGSPAAIPTAASIVSEPIPDNTALPSFFHLKGSLTTDQYTALDRLADQLRNDQDLKLVMTTYAPPTAGRIASRLFDAIRAAEIVVDYLQLKGVSDRQLFVRATTADAAQIDRRLIEFAFTTLNGTDPAAGLPTIGRDHPAETAGLITNRPLHYKVQVASARNALKEDFLEGHPYPMVEKTPGFDFYRYTLGAFTDKDEAESFRQKLRKSGRSSAYIATYIRGSREGR